MRTTEGIVLAGALGVLILQSPAGRAHTARLVVGGGRAAGPAAARAGRAAVRSARSVRERYEEVLTRVAPPRPLPCLAPGCTWEQESPSSAQLLEHMRSAHAPVTAEPAPVPASRVGPGASVEPETRRLRAVDDRPAERVTRLADGVYVSHQIEQVIDKIGLHMDEFRAVTRALNAAGDIQPASLLKFLEALNGVQTTLASAANMITDITEHADLEMWVDLRVLGPLYEVAGNVAAETQTVRTAMGRLRDLYAAEIEVEEKAAEGVVRTLNPKITAAA